MGACFFMLLTGAQNYVTLYEDCNYRGRSFTLEPGNYRLYQMKIGNDQLSGLAIPNRMKVTIYENDNFSGRSKTFTGDVACLDSLWNDRTSSIVVEADRYYPGNNGNNYVVFYNDCNSKGYSRTLTPGRYSGADLGNLKFNISSLAIFGNLQVKAYINNENLTGYSVVFDQNQTCLANSYNDKIGSVVIEYKQGNQPGNPGGQYNEYATVFTDCNYQGNSLRLQAGSYRGDQLGLLKYDISSIRLPQGLRAKVYINNDYLGGSYYTLTSSVSCLNSNMNDRIGSLTIENDYGNGNGNGNGGWNGNGNGNGNNGNGYPGNDRVIIFTDVDYKGQSASLYPGTYRTMAEAGFPDNALSSLQVPAGYRVIIYEEENFKGKSYTITQSKERFYMSGWNDKTSSIAVYRDK